MTYEVRPLLPRGMGSLMVSHAEKNSRWLRCPPHWEGHRPGGYGSQPDVTPAPLVGTDK